MQKEEVICSFGEGDAFQVSATSNAQVILRQQPEVQGGALIVIPMGNIPDLRKSLSRAAKKARQMWESGQPNPPEESAQRVKTPPNKSRS